MTSANEISNRQVIGLLIWLAAVFAVAGISGLFKPDNWYASLVKPDWTPPNWLFGPIWTILYATMAVAAWRVWRRSGKGRRHRALAAFVIQLLANGLWSYFFFGRHQIGLALLDIVLLVLLIAVTASLFYPIDRTASILLWPYLAWVTFAAILNMRLWQLN